jgi:membrane protease YdiL (CAAX protease family)
MPRKPTRKPKDWECEMSPGMGSRVAVSIVTFLGWLIFLILFLAFYAEGFSVYKNLAIVLASVLVGVAIIAPMWVHWGIKSGRAWEKKTRRRPKEREGEVPPGVGPRVAVSIVTGVSWLIFLILFLAFYAGGFSIYQNLAIVLASVLVVGAILGPMWAYWGIKTGHAWEKKARRKKTRRRSTRK